MVKNLSSDDFRAIRRVLEPDDFALSDGEPDPPPSDLIDRQTWQHIMTLPGDVAIRTTSHQGSRITLMNDLSSEWVFSMPAKGITGQAMATIHDSLEASIFNTVHGHYKTALTTLRIALETSVIAARCVLARDQVKWDRWNRGAELKFGNACDEIQQLPSVKAREDDVVDRVGAGIFKKGAARDSEAWARSLYSRLCRYSHARGDTTDASIWNSNGPIYSPNGFKACYDTFLETYALMLILARWGQRRMPLKHNGRLILRQENIAAYMNEPFRKVAAYYASRLWKSRSAQPRCTGSKAK